MTAAAAPEIVFISRVDTYFGRILAQHLGHLSRNPNDLDRYDAEYFSDTDFLFSEALPGSFEVFGTWRPEEHTDPYKPMPQPPKVPAARCLCRSDEYELISKIIDSADVCIFPIVDEDGSNEVIDDALICLRLVEGFLNRFPGKQKTMIFVSTVMTWVETKQIPIPKHFGLPEDLPNRFGEEEFRRRKPHCSYRKHHEAENKFLLFCEESNGQLLHTIIGAGIIYGLGENHLKWMVKPAWKECKAVKYIDYRDNVLPFIYVRDLCQIVHNVCFNPPKPIDKYIFAIENTEISPLDLAKVISTNISNGEVEKAYADGMLLFKTITSWEYDIFHASIKMEPYAVLDMKVKWVCPDGVLQAGKRIAQDFKAVHNLFPLKIAVVGPPFVGKTEFAKKIATIYGLEFIDATDVLEKAVEDLERKLSEAQSESSDPSAAVEKSSSSDPLDPAALLKAINLSKEKNGGKVADGFVRKFVRDALQSVACQNHGYILDGYPECYMSASELFTKNIVAEEAEADKSTSGSEAEKPKVNKVILPDVVFSLEAPEEFLKNVVYSSPKRWPSDEPIENHVVQRFIDYRYLSSGDDSVSSFYEEFNVPIVSLDMTGDFEKVLESAKVAAMKRLGKPRTLPLTPEEKEALLRKEADRRKKEQKAEEEMVEIRKLQESIDKERIDKRWKEELENLFRAEYVPPQPRKMLMRQYVMTYVLPVVSAGILSAVAEKPADPVDFLAEYILRNSTPLYAYQSVPYKRMTAEFRKATEPQKST